MRHLLWVILLLACSTPAGADPSDADKEREAAIAAQKKQAEEQWKGLLAGRPFAQKETETFLFYGTAAELDGYARTAEKVLAQVKKTLQIGPKDQLWKGKLVVHLCQQRPEFAGFIRRYAGRSPGQDETGSYTHERETTFITIGPPAEGKRVSLELELVQQIAAATLTKKSGRLPDWFVRGFGRSIAFRHNQSAFPGERARARRLVQMGKTAKDVWGGTLSADEGQILNASFVDYLINGPQISKYFPTILSSFGEETPFEDALKAAKLDPDAVNRGWWAWASR